MKYIRYTHVDAVSGLPTNEATISTGPVAPSAAGLTFGFALESQYPTNHPTFYGTCNDDADLGLPGVLGEVSQADYEAAEAAEILARLPVVPPLRLHEIAAAQLQVDGWDVTGIERSQGIAIAFMLDTDLLYVHLAEEQPDDIYIVLPSDGVTKFPDHVEVTRPGLANVSFIIQRVQ